MIINVISSHLSINPDTNSRKTVILIKKIKALCNSVAIHWINALKFEQSGSLDAMPNKKKKLSLI